MNTLEVNSIFEFLDKLLLLTPFTDLWYRGSSRFEYGLLPGLVWRKKTKRESNYIHDFLVRYHAYIEKPLTNPWEKYALMQHHGLPTRLLDWSSSPLSALYFALHQDPEWNGDRVIWMLEPRLFNGYFHESKYIYCPAILESTEIENSNGNKWNLDAYLPAILDKHDHNKIPAYPIAIDSPFSNKRLSAQHGHFTLHGSNENSLHIQLKNCDDFKVLSLFILKTKNKLFEFKKQIYSLGVNEETIYQDLDSMVKNIIREQG